MPYIESSSFSTKTNLLQTSKNAVVAAPAAGGKAGKKPVAAKAPKEVKAATKKPVAANIYHSSSSLTGSARPIQVNRIGGESGA